MSELMIILSQKMKLAATSVPKGFLAMKNILQKRDTVKGTPGDRVNWDILYTVCLPTDDTCKKEMKPHDKINGK